MSDKPAVLIVTPLLAPIAPLLEARYTVYCLWQGPPVEAADTVRAVITAGDFPLEARLLDSLPALGLIACFTAGYDRIDVADVARRGLQASYAPGVNDEDVADHALGLMLAARREIVRGDRQIRQGEWLAEGQLRTQSLQGQSVGIVGLGRIGQAVARRCEAFGLVVRWWGPSPKPDQPWPRTNTLLQMARESDILVVCAKLDETTRGMISAEVLDALGPTGLLVNVARGALVDEAALIERLRSGRLGGAALDVFEEEPTDPARWAEVPNTVITPHTAGATGRAVQQMLAMLLGNLDAYFGGRPLPTPIPR